MHNYLYIFLVFVMACSAKEEFRTTSLDDQIEANYRRNKQLLKHLNPYYPHKKKEENAAFFSSGSKLYNLKVKLRLTIGYTSGSKTHSSEYKHLLNSAKTYLDTLVVLIQEIDSTSELTQLKIAAQAQLKFAEENDHSWDGLNHLLLQFTQLEHKLLEQYLIIVGNKYFIDHQAGYLFFTDSVLLAYEPTQFVIKLYPLDLLDRVHVQFTEAKIYSVLDTSIWLTPEVTLLDKVGLVSFTTPESGTYQLEMDMVLTDTITGIEKKVPIKEDLEIIDEYWEEIIDLDSLATGLNFNAQSNYTTTKRKANELRASLAQAFLAATSPSEKEAILDSTQHLFTNYLLNQIVPYWYGTEWEFDGYTAIPNKGAIACGYFVSTTLKHMGVNVNRYKLAQQNPENESSTVAINITKLKKYKFEELGKDVLTELVSYKDGLYFVGLDYHVGYLYIYNQQPYFIHSDYLEGYVRIESAKTSSAFESYEYFISPISTNNEFIIKWLLQEELVVKRR